MSNKTQLQANNIELQGIIDIVQELPEAIPDELGTAITTDVLTGKTFTSDSGIMQQGGLDPETLKAGTYVWKKLTAEGGDFVDFVVNDTETAYPDGGMQEGYWYEKFNPATLIASNVRKDVDIWGVIGTLVEGVTGIDYGTVNFSSDAYNPDELTFSHNLGVVPSHVIVVASSFGINKFCASFDEDGVGMHMETQSGDVSIDMSVNKTAQNVTVTIGQSYLWSFPVARAIYWFAIA